MALGEPAPPVVALVGIHRTDYIRSVTLRRAAALARLELREVSLRAPGRSIRLGAIPDLVRAVWASDVVIVSYPAYKVVHVIALLARLSGAAVVLDSYVSIVDTKAERGRSRAVVTLAGLLERWAVRLVDVVAMDTPTGAAAVRARAGAPIGSVLVLGVASILEPPTTPEPRPERFRVLWYGHAQAMSGLETIVVAIDEVMRSTEGVDVVVCCRERDAVERFDALASVHPGRVVVHPGLPLDQLHEELRRCQLALGVFGSTTKAGAVVPNKVADALCAGLPVVTRRGPAVDDLASEAVVLIDPDDPAGLAAAVRGLAEEPQATHRRRREVAAELARERFTVEVLAGSLCTVLETAQRRHEGRRRGRGR